MYLQIRGIRGHFWGLGSASSGVKLKDASVGRVPCLLPGPRGPGRGGLLSKSQAVCRVLGVSLSLCRWCRCCPWRPVARGFERVAATVYGYLDDDDDSDFSEDPRSSKPQQRTSEEKKDQESRDSRSRTETMDEMFEQFFDAIDDLSDSELGNTCGTGLGLVIPKLRNDSEIAAHYNVPLHAINQLKAGLSMQQGM